MYCTAFNRWRGSRDLNSRAGFPTYSLSRGAPSPLGYFLMLNTILYSPKEKIGGEGGIRTHVTVKSNGFQDRLVMTASIPLHFCCRLNQLLYYITMSGSCQGKIQNIRDKKFSTFLGIMYDRGCWELLPWIQLSRKWKIYVNFFSKNDFFEGIDFTL